MTRDDFDQLILRGDLPGLVRVSQQITDLERAEWGEFARESFRKFQRMAHLGLEPQLRDANPEEAPALWKWAVELSKQHPDPQKGILVGMAVRVAFCIVATNDEIRDAIEFHFKTLHQKFFLVSEQVEVTIARQFPAVRKFFQSKKAIDWLNVEFLLPFILAGYIDRAQVSQERYLSTFHYVFNAPAALATRRRSDLLIQDYPELIEDLWLAFESPIISDLFVPDPNWRENYDTKGLHLYDSMGSTFCQLCEAGKLDRTRLLKTTIQAIGRDDFEAAHQKNYMALHDDLSITMDERAALTSEYTGLMSSRAPHAVKFALETLAALEKEKRLDSDAFYAAAAAVFQLKPKAYPKATLSLSDKHARRKSDCIPLAIDLALAGLTHDSAEIQEQAVKQLEGCSDRFAPEQVAALAETLAFVTASVRSRIQALIEKVGGYAENASSGSTQTMSVAPSADWVSDLSARAQDLRPHWRQLVGFDAALAAAGEGRLPSHLAFRMIDAPVLTACEPLVPIQDTDELFDAIAHAVERIDSADDVERIIDGIARLAPQRPKNLQKRSASLLKRLPVIDNKVFPDWKGRTSAVGLSGESASPELQRFVMSWLIGQKTRCANQVLFFDRLNEWQEERLDEIMTRALEGQQTILLSTPTHRGGWIDPRVFVQRLCGWQERQEAVLPRDLLLGLLRLAPEHREAARQAAAEIATQIGRMVRWALGSDERPTAADLPELAFWLAAGRCRCPSGEIPELKPFPTVAEQPFGAANTQLVWKDATAVKSKKVFYEEFIKQYKEMSLQAAMNSLKESSAQSPDTSVLEEVIGGDCDAPVVAYWEPRAKSPHEKNFLTVRQADYVRSGQHFGQCAFWERQWMASVWPLNADPYLSGALTAVRTRLNSNKASVKPG